MTIFEKEFAALLRELGLSGAAVDDGYGVVCSIELGEHEHTLHVPLDDVTEGVDAPRDAAATYLGLMLRDIVAEASESLVEDH